MKKIFIILIIIIASISTKAQDYNILFNPISLKYNSAELQFSYREGKNEISASYGIPLKKSILGETYDGFYVNPNQFKYLNMYSRIVRLGYRHYFIDKLYWGVGVNSYTSVFYGLSNPYNNIYGSINGSFYHTSINGELGYQLLINKRFIIEPYLGLEPMICNARINSISTDESDAPYMKLYINDLMNNNLSDNELKNSSLVRKNNEVIGDVYGNFKLDFYFGVKVGIRLNK